MIEINPTKLSLDVVNIWRKQWLLLTAGTPDDFNMMTVGWGSIGMMWGKPFAQVVVRPQRHTRKYMDWLESFTLCAFPDEYRSDLTTLGTISGKDGDKLSKTNLTVKASKNISAPSYNEANLILECRTVYYQDMNPGNFLDNAIEGNYESGDYHRIYYGEILAAFVEG
jgi:flavin reductase (DIM6/NTAB) family NADH-FMN oxidoreductase RutF